MMAFNTDVAGVATSNKFLVLVYRWMTLGLVITGFAALLAASNASFMGALVNNSILFWGLIIVEFALVIAISYGMQRMAYSTALLLYLLYSAVNGLTLSVIFLVYTASSIASTFFIAAGMFLAMSLYGYFTKSDLTKFGNFLMMALFGLIIALLVNIFWNNSTFNLIVSFIGVLIFVGLTAYDTQKLKQFGEQSIEQGTDFSKMSIMGALMLYLDFINIFLMLLSFSGRRR